MKKQYFIPVFFPCFKIVPLIIFSNVLQTNMFVLTLRDVLLNCFILKSSTC